ncbi:MAG: membrane protein insertion efficiency factor YidD [Deltaproteobacteria bacterium]|nr:membrane protein insertion efficiency factor YidD [Deltaproteobacteria bacterium]
MKRIILGFLRFYRLFISPFTLSSCRFVPTCSAYSIEAVERFGPAKGLWLTARRLLKCHPLHPGGFDPVVKSADNHEADSIRR